MHKSIKVVIIITKNVWLSKNEKDLEMKTYFQFTSFDW